MVFSNFILNLIEELQGQVNNSMILNPHGESKPTQPTWMIRDKEDGESLYWLMEKSTGLLIGRFLYFLHLISGVVQLLMLMILIISTIIFCGLCYFCITFFYKRRAAQQACSVTVSTTETSMHPYPETGIATNVV